MVQRKTTFIAVVSTVICVLTIGLCVGFAFIVAEHKRTLVDNLTAVATAEEHRKSLDALVAITKSSFEERASLRTLLLEEEKIIEFLGLIEDLAREQGVGIETSNLTVAPLGAFEEFTLTLNLTGSYEAVLHVLKLLETVPYQSSISRLQLMQGAGSEGVASGIGGEWGATVDMHITKYRNL